MNKMDQEEVVQQFAVALVQDHETRALRAEDGLKELTADQDLLIKKFSKQNERLEEAIQGSKIYEMVAQTKIYRNKLIALQKTMEELSERAVKIKKRALRLQQQKQQEALTREQAIDHELERERQLIARPAKRSWWIICNLCKYVSAASKPNKCLLSHIQAGCPE